MEYKVGFIDDADNMFNDYVRRLSRRDIELICTSEKMNFVEVEEWILQNQIKCMMIDYKLFPKFSYAGTDLVEYLNKVFPDLPCIILTAFKNDSLNEKVVISNLIEGRDAIDNTDITPFIQKIKNCVEVFENRLNRAEQEFSKLLEKRKKEEISSDEDKYFLRLYKILSSYGIVDDLPAELLDSKFSNKLDSILDQIEDILSK